MLSSQLATFVPGQPLCLPNSCQTRQTASSQSGSLPFQISANTAIHRSIFLPILILKRIYSLSSYTSVADTGGRGMVGVITPPLVAEHFVCSNSNFSPTGAITPDHPPPLWPSPTPPPPFRKSCIRACT